MKNTLDRSIDRLDDFELHTMDPPPGYHWSLEWVDTPGIFEDWLGRARSIYSTRIPEYLAGYFALDGIENLYARLSTHVLHGFGYVRTASEIVFRLRLWFYDFECITSTSCAIDGILYFTEQSLFARLRAPVSNVVYMEIWRMGSPDKMFMAVIDHAAMRLRVMINGQLMESDKWEDDCSDDSFELGPVWEIGNMTLQERVPVSIVWAVRRIETWWLTQRRERAARRIQRGLHKWLNAPVLRDGKNGIRPRLVIRHMFDMPTDVN
jgi:hypothetical protein